MVSSKVVVYNPRRWSSGIVKTMPATEELRSRHSEIWSFTRTVDLTPLELEHALEKWVLSDQRLRFSLSPGGKVLIVHEGVKAIIHELTADQQFASDNPFFWQIAVQTENGRIARVELLFRGSIGADSQLAMALFSSDRIAPQFSSPLATVPSPKSLIAGLLSDERPQSVDVGQPALWAMLRGKYPHVPQYILSAAVVLQTLRVFASDSKAGFLWETFEAETLGKNYIYIQTLAENALSFRDILTSLEVSSIDRPIDRAWAAITVEGDWRRGASNQDYALQIFLNQQLEVSRLTGCGISALDRIQGFLQKCLEAAVYEQPLDWTESAAKIFLEQEKLTSRSYPLQLSISELLEESLLENSTRIAIETSNGSMTFESLDRASDQLAIYLQAKGHGPGELIGIGLPRNESMIVSLLAVLKIGAGYVPLDPAFPVDRLRYMAVDAKISAFICSETLEPIVHDLGPVYRLVDIQKIYQAEGTGQFPKVSIDSESIAYVIYTSGSTGLPKGVMLSHRSVVNFILSMKEAPGMEPGDKILGVTTLSFDIAVLEIFLPLLTGATLYLATTEQAKDGAELSRLLSNQAITHFQATASTFRLILDAGWKGRIKAALCGGEAFPIDIARRLAPHAEAIWNMYGPTETTVWSSIHRLRVSDGMIPIGKAIANTMLVILDADLKPLLPGQKGEIYIAGSGLALGYIGLEKMTQERFVYSKSLDRRLYKTGDIGLMRWDGCFEIFGRSDGQIKLRGYRMELGEIEAVMSLSDDVELALAAVQSFAADDDRLIAYVKVKGQWNERDFRAKLKNKLPIYMLPQHYVQLETLPLLPNGKIDRKALPHPQALAGLSSDRENGLPLTSSQSRMLYVDALDDRSHVHNLIAAWILPAETNAFAFEQALYAVIRQQQALRMTVEQAQTNPHIRVHEARLPALERHKSLSLKSAQEFIEVLSQSKIDLHANPNFKMGIVAVESGEEIFYLLTHHIFWDGYSYSVFWKNLADHYQNIMKFGYSSSRMDEYTYSDYIRDQAKTQILKAGTAEYWRDLFASIPDALELATDYPRPAELTHTAEAVDFEIDSELNAAVQSFAKSHSLTSYHVFLSVYFLLLHRLSRQDDIVVGTPVLGRTKTEHFDLLGNFINALALRLPFKEGLTFRGLLEAVKHLVQNATSHADYPIERLVADLSLARDPSRTPLYSAMFFYQDHSSQKERLDGQEIKNFSIHSQTVDSDIVFWIERYESEVHAGFNYRRDLWEKSSISSMAAAYKKLLLAFIKDPDQGLQAVALSEHSPRKQCAAASPKHRHLWTLLEGVAESNPSRVALRTRDGRSTMSYADLLSRSRTIAAFLFEMGARPEDVIGISLSRHVDLIPSLWAILSLGATYLPLDPQYPPDRLQYMASDAKAKFLISEIEHVEPFRGLGLKTLLLDKEKTRLAQSRDPAPALEARPNTLAYIIYTSGSTGKPKGVEIEHDAVCHFLEGIRLTLGMDATTRTLAITTISFDISVLEIFGTLAHAGEIILVEQDSVMDGKALIAAIHDFDINFLQATPASWRLLLESGWTGKRDLVALSGGEALPKDIAQRLLPETKYLWNVYGPTEATVWATAQKIVDANDINIGEALPFYETLILDDNRQALPRGTVGNLYLGGKALARGYRFRKDLTDDRFYPHPLDASARIYDTGDLARYRLDGKIEYISRRDNQVKLRGFRIELGEIEHSIIQHPFIRAAVCIVHKSSDEDSRLLAYVILHEGKTITLAQIQQHLRTLLPSYMLPNQVLVLEAFPLTGSGKIDKKALPKEGININPESSEKMSPLSEQEEKVASIFRSILGTQAIRANDNFFDAGGHSLIAFKAIDRFQNELGLVLTVRDLLLRTVSQLAHDLDLQRRQNNGN
jgi:amino acid adenylation domain-containing protein